MASHQGLHCLLKRKSFYVKLMKKNRPDTPKMKNGLFLIIRMEESIGLTRVNIKAYGYTFRGNNSVISFFRCPFYWESTLPTSKLFPFTVNLFFEGFLGPGKQTELFPLHQKGQKMAIFPRADPIYGRVMWSREANRT